MEVSQEIVLSSRMLILHFEKVKTVTSSTVGTTCVGGLKLNKNRIVVDKVENISVNQIMNHFVLYNKSTIHKRSFKCLKQGLRKTWWIWFSIFNFFIDRIHLFLF